MVDSLWRRAEAAVRQGKWSDVEKLIERVQLEFAPGDLRATQAHYWLGEAYFARSRQLEAAREFRKASDETPNHPIAPEALLRVGDVYADLWRRPELDPTYGQTALATYQELLNRYPSTSADRAGEVSAGGITGDEPRRPDAVRRRPSGDATGDNPWRDPEAVGGRAAAGLNLSAGGPRPGAAVLAVTGGPGGAPRPWSPFSAMALADR